MPEFVVPTVTEQSIEFQARLTHAQFNLTRPAAKGAIGTMYPNKYDIALDTMKLELSLIILNNPLLATLLSDSISGIAATSWVGSILSTVSFHVFGPQKGSPSSAEQMEGLLTLEFLSQPNLREDAVLVGKQSPSNSCVICQKIQT